MIWFTSDLHLGHANIINPCERPFADVDEMDDALIDAVNDRVSATDVLWVLGDFAWRVGRDEVAAFRRRIVCREIHLVSGNHDKHWGAGGPCPFDEGSNQPAVTPYLELKTKGLSPAHPDFQRKLMLFHYPIEDWNGMFHGSVHLHGHSHNKPSYNREAIEAGRLRFDVGVDACGYAPVSLDEVIGWVEEAEGHAEAMGAGAEAVTPGAGEGAAGFCR